MHFIDVILHAMDARGLRPYHEEKAQLSTLINKVKQLWDSVLECLSRVKEICLALTFDISAHAKNHQCDSTGMIKAKNEVDF